MSSVAITSTSVTTDSSSDPTTTSTSVTTDSSSNPTTTSTPTQAPSWGDRVRQLSSETECIPEDDRSTIQWFVILVIIAAFVVGACLGYCLKSC